MAWNTWVRQEFSDEASWRVADLCTPDRTLQTKETTMGAWGYDAFDNDHALDWSSTIINEETWVKIKTALEGSNHDEIRAAAGLTIALLSGCKAISPVYCDIRQIAYDALKRVMWDGKWLDSWDDPATVLTSIQKQLRDLEDLDPSTPLTVSLDTFAKDAE
jgi:hypothetical protein